MTWRNKRKGVAEMKQKISIGLSVVACIIILGLLMLLGNYKKYSNIFEKQPVKDYGQLEVYIQSSSDVEQVNIWKSESDC